VQSLPVLHSESILPCTVQPIGGDTDRCLDFQEDLERRWEQFSQLDWVVRDENESREQWEPEGVSYYNGELILTPAQRWSWDEQMELLDWHPLLTG